MKLLFIKISHIFLSLLLLVATMGITIDKHYCMGRLKSVAIFQNAENCFGDERKAPMPCCEDVHQELRVDDLNASQFEFQSQLALVGFTLADGTVYISSAASSRKNVFPKYQKEPPPRQKDINISYQVFII